MNPPCWSNRPGWGRASTAANNSRPGTGAALTGPVHVLPEKTYLLNDAPAQAPCDERGKALGKTGRTIITNIPPGLAASEVPPGSDDHAYGGGSVTFYNGRYQTTDPVEQFYLDERGGFCTEAEWEAAWLSPAELEERDLERQQREVRQEAERLSELRKDLSKSRLVPGRRG